MRADRTAVVAIVGLAASLLACQTTFYDEYRAAHPGWEARLPREGERLEAVVAALFAPSPFEELKVSVTGITIRVASDDPWSRVDFEALRAGSVRSSDQESYVVFAERVCTSNLGLETLYSEQGSYYLLFDNRLQAWDHYDFEQGCTIENRFRAVRPQHAEVERLALQEFAARHPITHLSVADLYRRGLAYVEAGRDEEAYTMLELGDVGLARLSRLPPPSEVQAARQIDERVEAERLREKLRRALGLAGEDERARRAPDPRRRLR